MTPKLYGGHRLEELRELERRAKREWRAPAPSQNNLIWIGEEVLSAAAEVYEQSDRIFITALRNAAVYLFDEIERLQSRVDHYHRVFSALAEDDRGLLSTVDEHIQADVDIIVRLRAENARLKKIEEAAKAWRDDPRWHGYTDSIPYHILDGEPPIFRGI